MIRLVVAAALGAATFSAVASADSDARVRAAIASLVPGASIDSIAEAAMPGV
jgi:hypothetical protein